MALFVPVGMYRGMEREKRGRNGVFVFGALGEEI